MSGRVSMWGAQQIVTSYFALTSTPPPSFWLALIKDIPPNPYLSGAELDEPVDVGYTRVEIVNDNLSWANDSAPQEVYNTNQVDFVTASADWGKVSYWALCNASIDGYTVLIGELETPLQVLAGDQVILAAGDISATLGPFFLVEEE